LNIASLTSAAPAVNHEQDLSTGASAEIAGHGVAQFFRRDAAVLGSLADMMKPGVQ
jgi:hypothetical protein